MLGRNFASALIFMLSTMSLVGCSSDSNKDDSGTSTPSGQSPVEEVSLESLRVTSAITTVDIGETAVFTVSAINSDGSNTASPTGLIWHVSSSQLAINSFTESAALIQGVSAGSAHVWVTFDGISSNQFAITINGDNGGTTTPPPVETPDPTIASITIYPSSLRSNTTAPQQAIAVGADANNQHFSLTQTVTWSVSNPAAATVNNTGMLTITDTNTDNELIATYGSLTSRITITAQTVTEPPIANPVPDGFFVYLKKPANYDNVNIYVWSDGENSEPTGAWPGEAMTAAPEVGTDWYKFDLNDDKYLGTDGDVDFKFNAFASANDSGAAQSASDQSITQTTWYTTDTDGSTTSPNGETSSTNHIVYFEKPDNFSNVYLYAWEGETALLAQWPGVLLSSQNGLNDNWFSYDISMLGAGNINYIFNDGSGMQTGDLASSVSTWWQYDSDTPENKTLPNKSTTGPNNNNGSGGSGERVLLKSLSSSVLVTAPDAPNTNLLEQSVLVGSVLNVEIINPPIGAIFSEWSGEAAAYLVDPTKSSTQLIVVPATSITLQPNFQSSNTYNAARTEYARQCASCHGVDGEGQGTFPSVYADDLQQHYTVDSLAAYIEDTMPVAQEGECRGTALGDCAYDVARLLLEDALANDGASCSIDDLVAQDQNLRLLTKQEYFNSILDIFEINLSDRIISPLPEEGLANNFPTSSTLFADKNKTIGYQIAAEDIANQILNQRGFYSLTNCGTDTACLVENIGLKMFRRPLSSDEVSRYSALYSNEDGGYSVLLAMLQSPFFLYRSEIGQYDTASGQYKLSNYEIATLLSYTFWATTPDDTLLAAAASNNFNIQQQAERLINDDRAKDAFRRFAKGWMIEERYPFSAIDSTAIQSAMKEETIQFITNTVFDGHQYDELITADYTYVNSELADYYGLPAVTDGWQKRTYTGENTQRRGLLGQGSFLAMRTGTVRTSPIKRGVFVRRTLLCQEFPPPLAANLDTGDIPDSSNSREAVNQHTQDPACQSCHQYIDGIGFGLDNFGPDAKYRVNELLVDGGYKPVDARGEINSLDAPATVLQAGAGVQYSSVPELATLIADSDNSAGCYARMFYRYSIGRSETAAEECSIDLLSEKLRAGEQDLKSLMIEMVTMPNYILRK